MKFFGKFLSSSDIKAGTILVRLCSKILLTCADAMKNEKVSKFLGKSAKMLDYINLGKKTLRKRTKPCKNELDRNSGITLIL